MSKNKFSIALLCLFFSLSAQAVTIGAGINNGNNQFRDRVSNRITQPVPAVPEPSTFLLMSVGLGIILFSLKKNKN